MRDQSRNYRSGSVSRYAAFPLFVVLFPCVTLFAQGTGSIDGVVKGDQGIAVPGATIFYGRLAVGGKGGAMLPPVNSVITDAQGGFSVGNLAAATYLFCVQAVADTYLDPCHWSKTPPTFTVAAGQAIHGSTLNLVKGASVPITVADPSALLAQENVTPNAHLTLAAVAMSGVLHPAKVSNSAAASRTYTITIPFDTPTTLFIATGAFSMADAAGNPVASGGQSVSVTAPSNGAPTNLSFTLQGITKP